MQGRREYDTEGAGHIHGTVLVVGTSQDPPHIFDSPCARRYWLRSVPCTCVYRSHIFWFHQSFRNSHYYDRTKGNGGEIMMQKVLGILTAPFSSWVLHKLQVTFSIHLVLDDSVGAHRGRHKSQPNQSSAHRLRGHQPLGAAVAHGDLCLPHLRSHIEGRQTRGASRYRIERFE